MSRFIFGRGCYCMCSRGDIYKVNLGISENSSIQGGYRPVVVVSNDKNNLHSNVITIVPLTSKIKKTFQPTHVTITGFGLKKDSQAQAEQIRQIDKKELIDKNFIGHITDVSVMNALINAVVCQISN